MIKEKQNIKNYNIEFGQKSEDFAEEFIKNKGFIIIKKNFRLGKYGEIDIIANDKDTLVFLEVKARTNDKYGEPEEAVTFSKQRNIRRIAESYLYINKIENVPCRFDVISIKYNHGNKEIKHIENAF